MQPNKNNPIGIFDSGIGGLTVAAAIKKILPQENLMYFGDTAHLPYGEKAASSIKQYSTRIAKFLAEKKCKAIVIACNTISAVAFNEVRKHIDKSITVYNVIDPVAQFVAEHYPKSKVGVIATKATTHSRVYVKRINKLSATTTVTSLATPLLVPMIEEGYYNNNISQAIINSYLSKPSLVGIKAIVLGCTHFPLIKKEVSNYYKNKVEIIDSAHIVALHIKNSLQKDDLLNEKGGEKDIFYVSDYTTSFDKSTKIFFAKDVALKEKRLWD
jgi:glutamate racemase